MKRFILMSIFAFIVMAIGTAAAMPADHEAMKYGVSFTIPSVEFSTYDAVILGEVSYLVAETRSVETSYFHPPTGITKNYNSEFNNDYFNARVKKDTEHILPEIRKLSWVSVVAGSYRHI